MSLVFPCPHLSAGDASSKYRHSALDETGRTRRSQEDPFIFCFSPCLRASVVQRSCFWLRLRRADFDFCQPGMPLNPTLLRVFNGVKHLGRRVSMNRRDFLKTASTAGGMLFAPTILNALEFDTSSAPAARVAFVKTTDRAAGVSRAIDLLELGRFKGKDLFIKPNFNSADKTPGSTHEDTLATVLRKLNQMPAGPLTTRDRTAMPNTREVMEKKNAFTMGKELDAKVVVFDDLGADDWEVVQLPDSHC